MLSFVSWRLCVKRGEVGFDQPFAWGSFDDAVRYWWSESRRDPTQSFYLQTAGRGTIVDMACNAATMDAERKRPGLTDEAEREANVAASLAEFKRSAARAAVAPSR